MTYFSGASAIDTARQSVGAATRSRLAATLVLGIAVACAAKANAQAVPPADASPGSSDGVWVGQLTPYAWGSGLRGNVRPFAGAPSVSMDKSFSELLDDLDSAFFLSAYARRDRLVLLGDLSYSASSRAGLVPPGVPGEGSVRQRSLTLAAGWRVMDNGGIAVDVLGGFRTWSISGAVAVPLAGISRSPSERFTDPLLALRANLPLSLHWSLIAYADGGLFGVGAEDTHQWLITANYLHTDRWAFSFGMRELAVDYRDGGTRVDARLFGPLIGASWRF